MHHGAKFLGCAIFAAVVAVGGTSGAEPRFAAAQSATGVQQPPKPPGNGVMGFVVSRFSAPVVSDRLACPNGTVPRLREAYLLTLPASERLRLLRPESAKEYDQAWQAYAFGSRGENICSNPDMFERPAMSTVQGRLAWGFDLDGSDGGGRKDSDTCAHAEFEMPDGQRAIDNQEYRAMGCTPEWRSADANGGDAVRASQQFHQTGEGTQVILLRGVDSLVRDDDGEVTYANTADRPLLNLQGEFLPGASFVINAKAPCARNMLKGRILDGVLTTEPIDIALAQTWGQSAARDLRGPRGQFHFRRARLRLSFQADGSLKGMLGGYRPVFDLIVAPAIGGAVSATVAGIDCAQQLATARKLADGIRDPRTGKCTAVSSAMDVRAIPAFVTDPGTSWP